MFTILDIIGTLVFAMSGAMTAINKKMDLFGIFIVSFVTALGGGTLSNVLIGKLPVSWMLDINYIYIILAGVITTLIFKDKLHKLRLTLFLFDTIGLAVFTISGIKKGIDLNLHAMVCIAIGTMSACFGGVIRDILCQEVPIIFRKEFYATCCILGGIVFFLLQNFNLDLQQILSALFIIMIRYIAVKFNWSLKLKI